MPLSLPEFLCQMAASPALTLTVLLTLAVLLVNGWTDAPNAIAAAVVTGALPFRPAVGLAALCNLLGVLCVTAVNTSVAETIYSNASVLGGETVIGKGSVIAGSAFVTSSIPPHSRVSLKAQEITVRQPGERD